ncbi:MAG: D-alanine--D-alanine ligase [Acidobacteriota bacterium]|nr:D-alanine--D-alanine ligase [Acidobacteriota bacterium]
MKKITVGLLFGGKSGEHEVSLRSAASILSAIDRAKYDVIPIGITKKGYWRADPGFLEGEFTKILQQGAPVLLPAEPTPSGQLIQVDTPGSQAGRRTSIDVVFPVLHGPFGEDGTIQGLLELANVPYVGAGVLGSAVAMDKDVMKRLFQQGGLPTAPFLAFQWDHWMNRERELEQEVAVKLGYPCFVKPANLGSSIGISKAGGAEELSKALALAGEYDRKVIVEKALDAREIECSVLGNSDPQASLPGEIVPRSGFYDYQAKYLDDSAELVVPAKLRPDQVEEIREMALRSFQVLECRGMARVDFFLEKSTEDIYVNEINTIPGFTSISMYPKLWQASGLPYSELIDRLIQLALERHRRRQSRRIDGD